MGIIKDIRDSLWEAEIASMKVLNVDTEADLIGRASLDATFSAVERTLQLIEMEEQGRDIPENLLEWILL